MSWRGRVGVFSAVGLLCFAAGARPARGQAPGASGAGSRAAPDRGHYVLRSAADGTYVYREAGFSALVAADGTVTFHEANWTPHSTTYEILTRPEGWNEILHNRGPGWKPEVWPVPLPAETRPTIYDLREQEMDSLRPELPVAEPIFADPGLRADLTDQYTRLMGDDPYGPQKAAFLAGTFDVRMKMAAQQHRTNVRAAFDDLSRELVTVWGDTRFSVAERSHIIYLMWLDASADDADALRARRIIQDFAHRNLPPAEAARFASPGGRTRQPGAGDELPALKTDVRE